MGQNYVKIWCISQRLKFLWQQLLQSIIINLPDMCLWQLSCLCQDLQSSGQRTQPSPWTPGPATRTGRTSQPSRCGTRPWSLDVWREQRLQNWPRKTNLLWRFHAMNWYETRSWIGRSQDLAYTICFINEQDFLSGRICTRPIRPWHQKLNCRLEKSLNPLSSGT